MLTINFILALLNLYLYNKTGNNWNLIAAVFCAVTVFISASLMVASN